MTPSPGSSGASAVTYASIESRAAAAAPRSRRLPVREATKPVHYGSVVAQGQQQRLAPSPRQVLERHDHLAQRRCLPEFLAVDHQRNARARPRRERDERPVADRAVERVEARGGYDQEKIAARYVAHLDDVTK